uniref:RNA-dependent RNA polymerase n=1 Tax=Plasmopara viticola lesion associated narnavirus 25 TaxID=2719509 RepID=A0A6G9RWP7_9VIRU|nr:RNA-dependent RNA polymerase [Plasmopara viticola lesion associated narnavirus 25]
MAFKQKTIQLCADNLWYRSHPLAGMAEATQSHRELWRPQKSSSLCTHINCKDSGYAPQLRPLRGEVVPLVHDPITVSHVLLERIGIVEGGRDTNDLTCCECKALAKGKPLRPEERFSLMQSRPYRLYSASVVSDLVGRASRNHIIPSDVRFRAKRLACPTVDEGQHGETEGSTHQTPALHWHQCKRTVLSIGPRSCNHQLSTIFGEVGQTVSHMVRRAPYSKGLGSEQAEVGCQPRLLKTVDYGLDRIMRETIRRLCQVGTKPTLTWPENEFVQPSPSDCNLERFQPLVLPPKDREDPTTNPISGREDGSWWYGNDSNLRPLFSESSRLVYETRPTRLTAPGLEILKRKQCTQTLKEIGVIPESRPRPAPEGTEQSVVDRPCVGRADSCKGGAELNRPTGPAARVVKHAPVKDSLAESSFTQSAKPFIVSALRACATCNRVLRRRKSNKVPLSQVISEPCSNVLLQRLQVRSLSTYRFRNIYKVVGVRMQYSGSRRLRQRPGVSREGENTSGVTSSDTAQPVLHLLGHLRYETDLPLRECKITEGHCQVLQLGANPVSSARAAPGNPVADCPTTTLLRKTTGHETSPHCLPDSSVGIDFTPMGLLLRTLSGARSGTYYTAKKKRW